MKKIPISGLELFLKLHVHPASICVFISCDYTQMHIKNSHYMCMGNNTVCRYELLD